MNRQQRCREPISVQSAKSATPRRQKTKSEPILWLGAFGPSNNVRCMHFAAQEQDADCSPAYIALGVVVPLLCVVVNVVLDVLLWKGKISDGLVSWSYAYDIRPSWRIVLDQIVNQAGITLTYIQGLSGGCAQSQIHFNVRGNCCSAKTGVQPDWIQSADRSGLGVGHMKYSWS